MHMKHIEDKYKKMSDVEHVLRRPDLYIGSINTHLTNTYIFENDKFINVTYEINPGFVKIFDEIIMNSLDESKRNSNLNTISINIEHNKISVLDNGGIPVIKSNKFDNKYIPEVIFGELRTSSNYDDTEKRLLAGTNGIGAKGTNIFSKEFIVETSDGKNKFYQIFKDNLTYREDPIIKRTKESGYTRITYIPDLKIFNMDIIDNAHFKVLEKRIYDLSVSSPNIKFNLNGITIDTKSFKSYCSLYDIDSENFYFDESENWKFGITYSDYGFKQISFVNDIFTSEGGTHVEYVTNQIIEHIKAFVLKKHKLELRNIDIKNQLFIFLSCNVVNNRFNSQTKEKLITDSKDFGSEYNLPIKFLKQLYESEIIKRIIDSKRQKEELIGKAELRKLRKNIEKMKVDNLYDCTTKKRSDAILKIFEGYSALVGSLKYRDPKIHALYALRGKILNVTNLTMAKVLQNNELKGLISTLGLEIDNPSIKNLRYKFVYIYTDMDIDGGNITSLLLNFFNKYWPDLFKEGRIFRVSTPLMTIENSKQRHMIYTESEYEKFIIKNKNTMKNYSIFYKKGLGSLSDIDTKEMIENPRLIRFDLDDITNESLDIWFGDDSEKRKIALLN